MSGTTTRRPKATRSTGTIRAFGRGRKTRSTTSATTSTWAADRTYRRVAIIGGGANGEHEVSLGSAASAADALTDRHDVVPLTIDPHGRWYDAVGVDLGLSGAVEILQGCDVVLPLLHGPHGEDGTLAALCDLAGVPYVGSRVGASALAMDKWATKVVAEAAGVPTAAATRLTRAHRHFVDPRTVPCVVKPAATGSSLGVTLVRGPDDLAPAVAAAFEHDDRVLVEELVEGREVDLAVIARPDGSHLIGAALEIVSDGIFDYAAKYDAEPPFVVPAPLEETELKALELAAVAVYEAIGCRGLARIEFFLTADGPVLNEVNTTPGFTAQSQAPRMFAASGLAYPDLLELLIEDALVVDCGEIAGVEGRSSGDGH